MKTSTDHKLFKITLQITSSGNKRPARTFLASIPAEAIVEGKVDRTALLDTLMRAGWLTRNEYRDIQLGITEWIEYADGSIYATLDASGRNNIKLEYAPMEGDV